MLGRLGELVGDRKEDDEKERSSGDIEKGIDKKTESRDLDGDPDAKIAGMSAFYTKSEQLRSGIANLQASTKELEDLHRMVLDEKGATSGSSSSSKATTLASGLGATVAGLRKELDRLRRENEDIAKKLSPGNPFVRIRGAQVTQLSVSLLSTIQDFEDVQTKYRQKYQDKLQRQYKFIKPTATNTELERLIDVADGNGGGASGVGLIRAQISALGDSRTEARIALEQMRSRHKDIVAIEQSIIELHALFLEMKNLVYEQGDMINSIEASVEAAENYTRKADDQLKSAVRHQRARWKV
ncbi:t-SNARE family protein [Mitosporidium daphniae]|uniref:t-SNARE family protein n=1 Tax=Mitosporidium daphniae TaxID=1485682 RepID=A0A098VU10_9MICR|nr:t-SNARE family protein [Mitosporidium daphniae]KGG52415.1 t-SNARE family protein [Mitosporidium daphniae]|eukprot:XP_013238851.1 t-SNARE family protein [Mitosporidium daphniae]